jgi:membrane associated rhomboid family serine protease/Tfp pilus assembly protein PilF
MVIAHVSPWWPTSEQLIRWGANSSQQVLLNQQWWRLVTAAFVHIGAVHLLMNMWALWVLGTLAEAVLGTCLYLGVYFACAVAGALASLYWHPFSISAGASGAIMGILGAMLSVLKFAHLPLPKEILRSTTRSLVQGAVLTLAIGIFPLVDNAAHVGGLVCGLFTGLILSWTRRADYRLQRPLRIICLLIPFAVMVPLTFAMRKHSEPWAHYQRAVQALDARRYDEAEKEVRIALPGLPNRTAPLEILSETLFQEGNDAEARKYLQQLIAQNPANQFAVNRLAAIELKEDDAIGARDLLVRALPSQPRNAYAEVYLGRALQALNEDNDAITHYRRALTINPNLYEGAMALASLYEKHNQAKDAIVLYQKALQVNPGNLDALHGLAGAYLAAGMSKQASETIAQIQKTEGTANRGQGTASK